MALLNNSCFFCCKNVHKEKSDLNVETKLNSSNNPKNTPIILKEHLYQISNYLQLPKYQLDQFHLPPLPICPNCQGISEKLSNLCSDLEITKMKINYYLNLLTDQILAELPTDYNKQEHDQSNISAFQQIFQEKCLTTLSRTNVNPQLILSKCQGQTENSFDQQPGSDDMTDDYHEYQVNYQDNEDSNEEQLITGQVNQPTQRKLYDRSARKCEYCDKMISYTNVSSHKKMVHGIVSTAYRPNKPFAYSKLKERVGCEYCGRMLSYRNLSTHKKYYCTILLNKTDGRKLNRVVRVDEKDKFVDKPENVKQLLQTCEHCGQVVLRERFQDHEQLWCPITKGKMQINNYDKNNCANLDTDNCNLKMEQSEEWSVDAQLNL